MNKLERWTRPAGYIGANWPEHFVFLSQHRDSDSLTRSNFICGLEALGGESESVLVIRERHWAVGWLEWVAIHESDTAARQRAEEILKDLDGYPVVNESHWAELEWTEAQDYWVSLSLAERVRLCREHGLSIFSARREWMPEDDTGSLFEYLIG